MFFVDGLLLFVLCGVLFVGVTWLSLFRFRCVSFVSCCLLRVVVLMLAFRFFILGCSLCVVRCLLFVVGCVLCFVRCSLFVVCCVWLIDVCLVSVVWCMHFAPCRALLFVVVCCVLLLLGHLLCVIVCCLLFVACCLLFVVVVCCSKLNMIC